jgi:integrase
MAKLNLTAKTIEALKPTGSRMDYFDTDVPGLCLRITPNGVKSWSVMYRSGKVLRRLTIGTYPETSLKTAREEATDHRRAAQKGKDPAAEKKVARLADTFEELAVDYMERHAKKHKGSWKEDQRMLDAYLLPRFKHVRASDVSRAQVRLALQQISDKNGGVQANRVLSLIRKIYNWGMDEDLVTANPCIKIGRPSSEQPRHRILSDDEIRIVWNAAEAEKLPMAGLFKLLLLTLKRSGETRKMQWRDLDFDNKTWTIPAGNSKNKEPDFVPLSSAALRLLTRLREHAEADARKHERQVSAWVFPNPRNREKHMTNVQKFIDRVRVKANLPQPWTGHDLRRTARSYLGQLRVPGHISEMLMNHKKPRMVDTYDRFDYFAEKAEALETWARRIIVITSTLKEVGQGTAAVHAQ